ncbi:MAG: hypothetical protein ABEJ83_05030 [Candidatus Nanohaloarchaea archaeon]
MSGDDKNKTESFRVNEDTQDLIEDIVNAEGTSRSDFYRDLVEYAGRIYSAFEEDVSIRQLMESHVEQLEESPLYRELHMRRIEGDLEEPVPWDKIDDDYVNITAIEPDDELIDYFEQVLNISRRASDDDDYQEAYSLVSDLENSGRERAAFLLNSVIHDYETGPI